MTRSALNKSKVENSKQQILAAAIRVSARPNGWAKLTRDTVAIEAGCATGLVSKYFGTMQTFRRAIMRECVRIECVAVIAQGLAAGDPNARKASDALKRKALDTLAA